jgi:hypothetical protein
VRHDGGRRKQGCFDASTEPRWSDVTGILGRTKCPYGRATDLLNGLDFMAYTLCLTIADGNVAGNLLIIAELIRSWHLRVRETDPTGVQAKCLGEQDQMLAVVTHSLIKVVGVLSGHDEIVLYVSELAVFGYRPLKCLRLVEDELDMKMAFLIDHGNLFLQPSGHFICQWLVFVSPYTMPGFYGFLYCHILSLFSKLFHITIILTEYGDVVVLVLHFNLQFLYS